MPDTDYRRYLKPIKNFRYPIFGRAQHNLENKFFLKDFFKNYIIVLQILIFIFICFPGIKEAFFQHLDRHI